MRITVMTAAASLALALASVPALAQSNTALQAGRYWAQKRGAPDVNCYARVFARHAMVVERRSGGREWSAPATPAYNADMQRTCGIDRMALVRGTGPAAAAPRVVKSESRDKGVWRPPQQLVQRQPQAVGAQGGGAYQAGYRYATQRGISNKDCFARWYARKASPMPNGGYAIWSYHHNTGDLWQECRIAL